MDRKLFFPPGIDRLKLELSEEAYYSISHWKDANAVSARIKLELCRISPATELSNVKIVDGTACVGGNSISFGREFQDIVAVEISEQHKNMLDHNLAQYGLHHVTTLRGDITSVAHTLVNRLKVNVMFLDPPWGGPEYKENRLTSLVLSGNDVSHWIRRWSAVYNMIVMKVPNNFDTKRFIENLGGSYTNIELVKMVKYMCVIVTSATRVEPCSYLGLNPDSGSGP